MAKRNDNPAPADVTNPAGATDRTALPPVQFEAVMPRVHTPEPPVAAATAEPSASPAVVPPVVSAPIAPPPRLSISAPRESSRGGRFALLAASVAMASATGAVLGAAGTAFILPAPAASTVQAAGNDEVRALKESIVRLSSELVAVKASVESAAKSASGQVAKLAERTEKAVEKAAEKAQAEPSAKLAKIAESLDRLEKRPVQAAAAPAPAPAPETTGSVPAAPAEAAKQSKSIVEGWVVRDIFDGRALVESRFGTMLEVGPGSSIPGIGRVEAVRRQEGRWVVITPKGLITSLR
jgi:hypothetical protein